MNCQCNRRGILLLDARDVYDPETASSSGASHVPSQPLKIPSPGEMCSCDSGLPLDARNTMGTSGNVFEKACLLEKDHPQLSSRIHGIWHHLLADGHQEILWNMEEERDEIRRVLQYQHHALIKVLEPLHHAGGTYSQNGVMDYPRCPISELYLGKCLDSLEFQSWKVNFKTEVCANSVLLQITMHWALR